jgi:hypothetical protein
MPHALFPGLKKPQRVAFILISLWLILVVFAVNSLLAGWQARNDRNLPFGILSSNGTVSAQDFAYNMLYFKGIRERLVSHPYRFEDQEKMIRQLLPAMTSGRTHAYSPVAFVLALPLIGFSGREMYLLYTILNALGFALLYYYYLLPRAEYPLQLFALIICALSVWLVTTFAAGQSSILTTALIGGFWCLLKRRPAVSSFPIDVSIALLFWMVCLKPSVAIIPFMLLLGTRAWRPLILGIGMLLITWIFVGDYYGGWWTGFWDYLYLLNHYHDGGFTPFLRTVSESAADKQQSVLWFSLKRDLLLFSSLALLALRLTRRINGSEQFQGMVWSFLLFSPYIMPSENLILCLLVVEGSFFHSSNRLQVYGKLLLLLGILDLRTNVTFFQGNDFQLKCLLFIGVMAEWLYARWKGVPLHHQEEEHQSVSWSK